MFNLQSGIHRQRFPPRLTPIQAKRLKAEQAESSSHSDLFGQPKKFARGEGKHTGAVTGIVVDSLNKIVISCGEDGKVKFWDFAKGLLLQELDWSLTSIRGMRYHRASDLIAMSCDDGSIRVVDSETRKLVRELWGAKGNILDFIFSNDGRWILAASSDSCLRVYDLATGHLIEALRFRSQPVAIAFSNTGEYLATAHEDSVGVHIWTNRTLFTHVPTRQITPEEIFDMDGPTASGEGGEGIIEGVFHEANVDGVSEEPVQSTIDQLSADLLTLSLVPKARWQTLLHLDTIRTRNKPKEPVQKPKAAPFFLPSVSDTTALPSTRPSSIQRPSPYIPYLTHREPRRRRNDRIHRASTRLRSVPRRRSGPAARPSRVPTSLRRGHGNPHPGSGAAVRGTCGFCRAADGAAAAET